MTIGQVEDDILRGGRFRTFSWNFSIVVMSFKRGSSLTYVRSDQWTGTKAFPYTLVSLVVGWWGIPFGIFFTIATLYRNALGGYDNTTDVLNALVGPQRTAGIMARAAKPKADPSLWLLRGVTLLVPLSIIGFFSSAIDSSRDSNRLPSHARRAKVTAPAHP